MKMVMNRIQLILGLTLLIGFVGSSQENPAEEQARKALNTSTNLTWEANKELTTNDFTSAEATYRKAISKSKKNATAPYNLGNAYYNRESFGEAFGRYKQAGEAAEERWL